MPRGVCADHATPAAPDQGTTSGAQSTAPLQRENLALAGAPRASDRNLASQQLGVPDDQSRADGAVAVRNDVEARPTRARR